MHFCQQEMLVYSCSIKICALRFNKLLESIFWLLLVVEAFPLQKVLKMLKEVVVSWQEVRWTWQMRQNFVAQFVQLLKCWATCGRVLWRTGPTVLTHILAAGVAVSSASHRFAEHTSQIQCFHQAVVDHQTVTMNFFGTSLLWEVFWSFFSVQPLIFGNSPI